jgi:hypothetical protein
MQLHRPIRVESKQCNYSVIRVIGLLTVRRNKQWSRTTETASASVRVTKLIGFARLLELVGF